MSTIAKWIAIAACFCMLSTPCLAARHAVLIGVGKYPIVESLYGPRYDVEAIKNALVQNWDFPAENIETLLDSQGTKKNILAALSRLKSRSKKGDELFVYMSGHGTSAGDQDIGTPLPTTTGAYIPYDIQGIKSVNDLVDHLVIGSRDLQPIFKDIDSSGRHLFVAVDACYSGNTVRGQLSKAKLPTRAVKLSELLPKRAVGSIAGSKVLENMANDAPANYPYGNVYYLSASGEYEPAQDIPPNMIALYPTYDGNPHGAFTDTLLRALMGDIDADVDSDGSVSYAELRDTLQREMRNRGFSSTPQGLPALQEDYNMLAETPVFGSTRGLSLHSITQGDAKVSTSEAVKTSQPASAHTQTQTIAETKAQPVQTAAKLATAEQSQSETDFTVSLGKGLQHLAAVLNDSGIQVVDRQATLDARINQSSSTGVKNLMLVSSSGDLISEHEFQNDDDVIRAIEKQAWVHKLVNAPMKQDFLVQLSFDKVAGGSVALDGDVIGFNYRGSRGAYLVLVDVNPKGEVTVLYPFNEDELIPIGSQRLKSLKNIAQVTPPYGRDFVMAYAFAGYPKELERLMGKTIAPGSQLMSTFQRMINTDKLPKARAVVELVTAPRN